MSTVTCLSGPEVAIPESDQEEGCQCLTHSRFILIEIVDYRKTAAAGMPMHHLKFRAASIMMEILFIRTIMGGSNVAVSDKVVRKMFQVVWILRLRRHCQ